MSLKGELILIAAGSGSEQSWPIETGSFVFGRGSTADWRITERVVSRQQFRIICNSEGCWVENLSRTNPTYYQGAPLRVPTRLRDGDVLGVGRLRLQYRSIEREENTSPKGTILVQQIARPDRRWVLHKQEIVVGRDPTCDVVLDFPAVSRQHLRLVWQAGGCYRVSDMRGDRQSGACMLDDRPLLEPRVWRPGHELWLGDALGNGVLLIYYDLDGSRRGGQNE